MHNQIADAYVQMGNAQGARKYIGLVLEKEPRNEKALNLLKLIEQSITKG